MAKMLWTMRDEKMLVRPRLPEGAVHIIENVVEGYVVTPPPPNPSIMA